MQRTRVFLTARWNSLVFLNYVCPPELLLPHVPIGTELDRWGGSCWLSVVGFMFRDTRLLGVSIPLHRSFEEVNLRFYVRRTVGREVRRGVVFIRELVPHRAIALIAHLVYNEPYLALPMAHDVSLEAASGGSVRYAWTYRGRPFELAADVEGPARPLAAGGDAEFITEHFWGYTRQHDGSTLEYRVEHPRWAVWPAARARFTGPADGLYGTDFGAVLAAGPASAHVAFGSAVAVYTGSRVTAA